MKRMAIAVGLAAAVFSLPGLRAAEKPFETGKIVDVQQKAHTRVLYCLVNTPVTQDDPYYELSAQVRDSLYLAEYIPVHAAHTLPDDWQPGSTLEARVEKHSLYLRRSGGEELQLRIVKRTTVLPTRNTPDPETGKH